VTLIRLLASSVVALLHKQRRTERIVLVHGPRVALGAASDQRHEIDKWTLYGNSTMQ